MTTLKLTQVIALERAAKSTAASAATTAYQTVQKGVLFSGQERVYQPKDEEGDQYPPEPVKLQLHAEKVLRDLVPAVKRFWDLTLTKDVGNQDAVADVIVEGQMLLQRVPVTTLLFLEKQLSDLATLINKLPVLDLAEDWSLQDGVWRTPSFQTTKTKKVSRVIVRAAATDKHPAQTEIVPEDTVVGHWRTTKLSGALPVTRRQELLEKVQKLQAAVKVAREAANLVDAPEQHMADTLFSYLDW